MFAGRQKSMPYRFYRAVAEAQYRRAGPVSSEWQQPEATKFASGFVFVLRHGKKRDSYWPVVSTTRNRALPLSIRS